MNTRYSIRNTQLPIHSHPLSLFPPHVFGDLCFARYFDRRIVCLFERKEIMERVRKLLLLEPLPGYAPGIDRALAAFEDSRQRTKEALGDLPRAVLDWTPSSWQNSIGSLLYHIAAIEMDWLFAEILEEEFPEQILALFPYPVRDDNGRLTVVAGLSLADHLARMDALRAIFLEALRNMSPEEFVRARSLEPYDVTPAWVLHHLLQHEAEHRGHIHFLRTLAETDLA
jgi:uncharacterized damage-inducible protein DinB